MPKPIMLQIQLDKQSADILNELKSRNLKAIYVNSAIKHYAKNCETDIFFNSEADFLETKLSEPKADMQADKSENKTKITEW